MIVTGSDDHKLNHCLVFDPARGYVLAEAFDVVPQHG
jgi:hypothetical protein